MYGTTDINKNGTPAEDKEGASDECYDAVE